MGRLQIRWLLAELPKLEAEGVIDGPSAGRLRAHYGGSVEGRGRRVALAVCAVFGALLVGGGVILLLAHNWEHLSRGQRAAIALAPLVAAQVLAGWVLLRRETSTAWREGSAILLALMVATAVALVDQTYHAGGDLESFLWRWSLLLAPLPWLLNSTGVAMLFLGALTWWAGAAVVGGEQALLLWPLAAAGVIPHALQVLRSGRRGLRAANLQWAVAVFLCVAAALSLERGVPGLWILIYCGLFALMIAVGTAVRGEEDGLWRRPLEAVGVLGSAGLWLVLTFVQPWDHIGWRHLRTAEHLHGVSMWFDVLLAVGLPAAAVVATAALLDRRRNGLQLLWVAAVPVAGVVWPVVAATDAAWLGALAFNLVLFTTGVGTIAIGIQRQHLGTVNLGMLALASLVVVRFFDSELGFVARGLGFIIVGLGFLAANVVLSRRLRADL
jgi:uncharacterized membrane protein